MCGCYVADNGIADAGLVALAKALESGQCELESLNLAGESGYMSLRMGNWACSSLSWAACFRLAASVDLRVTVTRCC